VPCVLHASRSSSLSSSGRLVVAICYGGRQDRGVSIIPPHRVGLRIERARSGPSATVFATMATVRWPLRTFRQRYAFRWVVGTRIRPRFLLRSSVFGRRFRLFWVECLTLSPNARARENLGAAGNWQKLSFLQFKPYERTPASTNRYDQIGISRVTPASGTGSISFEAHLGVSPETSGRTSLPKKGLKKTNTTLIYILMAHLIKIACCLNSQKTA